MDIVTPIRIAQASICTAEHARQTAASVPPPAPLVRQSSKLSAQSEKSVASRTAAIVRIEELVGAPIDIISTGPDREETILLRHPFGG